jgi:hypothetical protein
VACIIAAALAACGSSDDVPDPAPTPTGPVVDAATVQAALLKPADVGSTWSVPAEQTSQNQVVSLCGGDTPGPAVPGGASVVSAPLVDEGAEGAQTLFQTGLVYPDATAAAAGLAALRTVADACPPSVDRPARTGGDRQEPAYTETVRTTPLEEGGWTGFVVIRHKAYEPRHPGTADTAVAVAAKGNVVVVDAYAVYRLGAASAAPQFDSDWKKLVGTVLNRLDR